jgi:hypothetical protein
LRPQKIQEMIGLAENKTMVPAVINETEEVV